MNRATQHADALSADEKRNLDAFFKPFAEAASQPVPRLEQLAHHPAIVYHSLGLCFCSFVIDMRAQTLPLVSCNVNDILGHPTTYYQGQPMAVVHAQIYPDDRSHVVELHTRAYAVYRTLDAYGRRTSRTVFLIRMVRATGEVAWMQMTGTMLYMDPETLEPVYTLMQFCEAAAPPDHERCAGTVSYEVTNGRRVYVPLRAGD